LNEALESIRIAFYHEQGFSDTKKLKNSLTAGSETTKRLGLALAASYATIFEFANASARIISTNLDFLCIYARELPVAWFSPIFIRALLGVLRFGITVILSGRVAPGFESALSLLRVHVGRSQSQEYVGMINSVLCDCAHAFSSSKENNLLEHITELLMLNSARNISLLDDATVDALALGLSQSPLSYHLLTALSTLSIRLCNHGILDRLFKSLLLPPNIAKHGDTLDQLVQITRCFAEISAQHASACDASLDQSSGMFTGLWRFLGLQPHVPPFWIQHILEDITHIQKDTIDAFLLPVTYTPPLMLSERQIFAVLGVL
jgi:hypothetical protein